jgi:crossover junction endodeoxyribonuclease RuvC
LKDVKKLRVLGIDPGLRKMGWAVVYQGQFGPEALGYGVICPPCQEDISKRLAFLYQGLKKIFQDYGPSQTAVEKTLVNANGKATLQLALARGVAIMMPGLYESSFLEYSPTAVKKALTGHGSAAKEQVAFMVHQHIKGLTTSLGPDITDAFAIALCGLFESSAL